MAGVNKVILVGNLGKDPEMRYTPNGVPVCSFPMATSESYKDRNSGERITQTEWHNIVIWRGMAETAEKYLHKGSQVFIEGKIKTRSWEDQLGQKRYTTEIIADVMQLLDRPGTGGASASESQASMKPAAQAQAAQSNSSNPAPENESSALTASATPAHVASAPDGDASDLPF